MFPSDSVDIVRIMSRPGDCSKLDSQYDIISKSNGKQKKDSTRHHQLHSAAPW